MIDEYEYNIMTPQSIFSMLVTNKLSFIKRLCRFNEIVINEHY